jgi:pimeloyl-ACP methyl ester carboxylesterase
LVLASSGAVAEARGSQAIAVDLPGDDPNAGLDLYAKRVIRAIGRRKNAILVAQSLGGFTAALVCAGAPVRMLVFVNAMIPLPGETAGDWWDATGSLKARMAAARRNGYGTEFDVATYFLHDVPPSVARKGAAHQREQVAGAVQLRQRRSMRDEDPLRRQAHEQRPGKKAPAQHGHPNTESWGFRPRRKSGKIIFCR